MGRNLKVVVKRSPEREVLALAIDRHGIATETLNGIHRAKREIDDKLYGARSKAEAAAEAVETAKANAAQHLVDVAIGKAGAPPLSVKAARLALQDAEDELETVCATSAALTNREREINPELAAAGRNLDEALQAVISASPAVLAVYDEYVATQRRGVELRKLMEFFGEKCSATPASHKGGISIQTLYQEADVGSQISEWQSAITALRSNADAALPER